MYVCCFWLVFGVLDATNYANVRSGVSDAGTSDPYVKFKVDGKTCYRSRTVMRNLNPKWDEKFTLMVEDLSKLIDVRVYDYDRGLRDDWMGSAVVQPSQLPFNVSV